MARAYGSTDPVKQLPPNSQLSTPKRGERLGFWRLGIGSWKLPPFSARQTIPGAEDLAQKPLVFFVNLDTL